MVSRMVFLTKLGFENLKNLITPSPFCKVGRVTELLDGRVTSSPWKTKKFQGLDDHCGLKRPNHHLDPEYVHLFRAKKYGKWGVFSEEFQVLCKNPDEVTRFDGTRITNWQPSDFRITGGFQNTCWNHIRLSDYPNKLLKRVSVRLFRISKFFVQKL
jgi:hypothetical protein